MKAKRLGRGVQALLGEESPSGVQTVRLEKISPGEGQPRKHFNDEKIAELAQSIREQGVIQPILVESYRGDFRIVAGERRFRAAKEAGLQEVPVIVRAFSDRQRKEIALTENLQREDLNAIEEAQAMQELLEMGELTHDHLADHLGISRSAVTNSLRLLKLTADIQKEIVEGHISAGHARALLSLKDHNARKKLVALIIHQGISVREAEVWSTKHKAVPSRVAAKPRDVDVEALEEQLVHRLGTKVHIRGTLRKGVVEVSFFSADDLNRLITILDVRSD